MRVVAISDTHNFLHQITVPDGDILVHAGDHSMGGTVKELAKFNSDLGKLPHKHKVVVAGNHDWLFESDPALAKGLLTNATYLQDELVEIDGVKIYGSPWTPRFHDWAFNADRGHVIRQKWDLIPNDLDVLITHGPPRGHGSKTLSGTEVGCTDLLLATQRAKPHYHVFGHIHEGYGITRGAFGRDGLPITYVNAATCNARYAPTNPPYVLEL